MVPAGLRTFQRSKNYLDPSEVERLLEAAREGRPTVAMRRRILKTVTELFGARSGKYVIH
jgi:hypothetical protein